MAGWNHPVPGHVFPWYRQRGCYPPLKSTSSPSGRSSCSEQYVRPQRSLINCSSQGPQSPLMHFYQTPYSSFHPPFVSFPHIWPIPRTRALSTSESIIYPSVLKRSIVNMLWLSPAVTPTFPLTSLFCCCMNSRLDSRQPCAVEFQETLTRES